MAAASEGVPVGAKNKLAESEMQTTSGKGERYPEWARGADKRLIPPPASRGTDRRPLPVRASGIRGPNGSSTTGRRGHERHDITRITVRIPDQAGEAGLAGKRRGRGDLRESRGREENRRPMGSLRR